MVVDEALDALGYTEEQLFTIKDGRQLAADVIQQGERLGLLRVGSQKARWDGVHVA